MANPLAKRKTTDWTLCCFCQLKSSEILKHPYQKSCYTTRHTLVFKMTLINLLKVWLELLRLRAYDTYCQSIGPHEPLDKWEQRIYDKSRTAFYWGHILRNFLLTYFSFIRNRHHENWLGTLESIEMLRPYFFSLGHTDYCQWVTVFLRDMAQLPTLHPDVHDNFMKGHFVVQKSEKFSLRGLDQSQENSIRMLKEYGDPKGLYHQVEKMVIELSRAEVLRVVEEFEDRTAHIIQKPTRNIQKVQHLNSRNYSVKPLIYWDW